MRPGFSESDSGTDTKYLTGDRGGLTCQSHEPATITRQTSTVYRDMDSIVDGGDSRLVKKHGLCQLLLIVRLYRPLHDQGVALHLTHDSPKGVVPGCVKKCMGGSQDGLRGTVAVIGSHRCHLILSLWWRRLVDQGRGTPRVPTDSETRL